MISRKYWFVCSIIATLAILFLCVHLIANENHGSDILYPFQQQRTQIQNFVIDKSDNIIFNEFVQRLNRIKSNSSRISVVKEVVPVWTYSELSRQTLERLRIMLDCKDRSFEPVIRQRGEFWVLSNFVKAEHASLRCHEAVTYTTHGDYTFMDNLVPLLERWRNPISIAIHAPGTDMFGTVDTIRYLRDCTHSDLVKTYATFHVYFSNAHIPEQIPNMNELLPEKYDCSLPVPYEVEASSLYKTQNKLLYPVNVGRNIARESALTHYVLASDIELYPSPMLAQQFLKMIVINKPPLNNTNFRVFPISIFEVERNQSVPMNKTELVEMLKKGLAIPFHKRICAECHNVPNGKEWMLTNETQQLEVFHVGKRINEFIHWEPIFIGTNAEPLYDERLSWEGQSDKMTQGYVLCVMDYDFMILNNAFLVHRPGIKTMTKNTIRAQFVKKTNELIHRSIFPELQVLYGTRKGCAV